MTALAEVLPPANDIVLVVEATPQIVLLEPEKFDQFYERVRAETETLVVDVSTKKGRDAIIAMASKVTKSKTMIDKARLQLTGAWREQTNQVNAAGKEIETKLAALAKEVRQPVTDWEEAEKARIEECRGVIDNDIKQAAIVQLSDTADMVRQRGKDVWNIVLDPAKFGDLLPEAEAAKAQAVETLKAALARLTKEEADRAELERLRAEAIERERQEQERIAAEEAARAVREAADRAAKEAEEAEARRVAAEKAEAERIERAREQAAADARREAEETARKEREEAERAKQAEIDAANERARQAEEAAQAERDRIAAAEAERAAEEKRIADQKAADEANKALQRRLKTEAKEAIMSCGVSEDAAQKIVLAVRAREIPHIGWIV